MALLPPSKVVSAGGAGCFPRVLPWWVGSEWRQWSHQGTKAPIRPKRHQGALEQAGEDCRSNHPATVPGVSRRELGITPQVISQQAGGCMVAESRGGVVVEVSWLQTIHPHPEPVVVDNMGRVWRKSRVERVVRSSGSQLGGQAEYAYSGAGSERGWTPPAMSSAWVKSYASREISRSYPSFVVRQFAQNWCVMSNHDWEPASMACSKNHCFNTVHEYFDVLLKLWLTI